MHKTARTAITKLSGRLDEAVLREFVRSFRDLSENETIPERERGRYGEQLAIYATDLGLRAAPSGGQRRDG